LSKVKVKRLFSDRRGSNFIRQSYPLANYSISKKQEGKFGWEVCYRKRLPEKNDHWKEST